MYFIHRHHFLQIKKHEHVDTYIRIHKYAYVYLHVQICIYPDDRTCSLVQLQHIWYPHTRKTITRKTSSHSHTSFWYADTSALSVCIRVWVATYPYTVYIRMYVYEYQRMHTRMHTWCVRINVCAHTTNTYCLCRPYRYCLFSRYCLLLSVIGTVCWGLVVAQTDSPAWHRQTVKHPQIHTYHMYIHIIQPPSHPHTRTFTPAHTSTKK